MSKSDVLNNRKRRFALLCIAILCLSVSGVCQAQSIGVNNSPYYERELIHQYNAVPMPYVRENDVVWEHIIWRIIDMREKFNHFFYYPIEASGSEGRLNFAYTIWNAVRDGDLMIFADDELKIPLDNNAFIEQFTKPDTLVLEIVDDDENYEYKTVLVPKEFNSEEVLQVKLKEAWYIDKQTTEQRVCVLCFCVTKELYKEHDGDLDYIGSAELFWIPMQAMSTRTLLKRREAYNAENLAALPTWEQVFITRMFSSYVYRQSNVYNRAITDYLTGTDAIWESERIESELLNISCDMWEY